MTIRDLGYKRYEGPRLPFSSRYRVMAQRALSLQWASGLVKTTLILGTFPMVVCGAVLFLKVRAQQLLGAGGLPLQLEDPGRWVFYCSYWGQLWFAFAMSLLVAAPAIAQDVRTGAFQFYFARPVSRGHYLAGKLLPVALWVLLLCGAPGLLLALLRLGLVRSGGEALAQLPLLLATIAYVPLYTAALALPPIALGSLTRRSGTAQGSWAALFFLPWILGESLAAATGVPYAVLVSIPTNLRLVGQALYGIEPSYPLPWLLPAAALLLLIGGSAWIVLWRLNKVEVFS